ncbi:hypothetical protein CWC18_14405 [Pseudoalteromonas aurantia]|uniref:Orphan protein n=1 Tax=Pseudoalteromonas aurantia TaxID=43654 RepID=A0A5S3V9C4_9GAMM|nr:hypothetical protein [Pseudoalteromonas aurantia]TMO60050.1 hypothetical protein CWC18_14405 [Pseudoalteromonas aurantia]TMO68485.1 hypothetical protein CWC19_09405 [Pseudoalteromonas aurantia]TMO73866.1 hypothetical protein CWC20_12150 [Pseudoalteromonas aurantia]
MKFGLPLCVIVLLSACQNYNSAELNHCAQQNYQCESSCKQSNTPGTMSHDICDSECIDSFNQCKAQVEKLTKNSNPKYQ